MTKITDETLTLTEITNLLAGKDRKDGITSETEILLDYLCMVADPIDGRPELKGAKLGNMGLMGYESYQNARRLGTTTIFITEHSDRIRIERGYFFKFLEKEKERGDSHSRNRSHDALPAEYYYIGNLYRENPFWGKSLEEPWSRERVSAPINPNVVNDAFKAQIQTEIRKFRGANKNITNKKIIDRLRPITGLQEDSENNVMENDPKKRTGNTLIDWIKEVSNRSRGRPRKTK